ncbi:MAG: sorbosone dehydrogenase family protein [Solirubrobacterales bacterium]
MGPKISAILAVALATAAVGCGGADEAATTKQPTAADTSGSGVKLEPIAAKNESFGQPVYVTQPPGNSRDLYVVDRTGKVEIVRDGSKLATPFFDISAKVETDVERGLLSIAFAPDYNTSGLLYAYYTDRQGNQNVVEMKRSDDPDKVDPASERQVLQMADYAPNHNGGLLTFGSDGHLYIGTGDGGGTGDPRRNAQNLGSLLGKLLRIDPQASGDKPYSIPADNPFAGKPGARPEIYSYGLRNPWRYSFDSKTNALTIGDVGQDEFEEVDIVAAGDGKGANFGWSAFEGDAPFNRDQSAPAAVKPALVYDHHQGCSINGGYVVRDPYLPALEGRYVYSDFCSGKIRSFKLTATNATDDKPTGLETRSPTSFGVDNAGHVYVTTLTGDVFRLAPG